MARNEGWHKLQVLIMKKVIYFMYVILATVLMTSCITQEWDPDEEIKVLSDKWSSKYVDNALRYAMDSKTSLKDTLSIDFTRREREGGDSVNICSVLFQIKDSMVVTVDGYRYADKFRAHLYTVGAGIINYKGKFRVDFYETGKDTPWISSEIEYSPSDKSEYKPYSKGSKTIWY